MAFKRLIIFFLISFMSIISYGSPEKGPLKIFKKKFFGGTKKNSSQSASLTDAQKEQRLCDMMNQKFGVLFKDYLETRETSPSSGRHREGSTSLSALSRNSSFNGSVNSLSAGFYGSSHSLAQSFRSGKQSFSSKATSVESSAMHDHPQSRGNSPQHDCNPFESFEAAKQSGNTSSIGNPKASSSGYCKPSTDPDSFRPARLGNEALYYYRQDQRNNFSRGGLQQSRKKYPASKPPNQLPYAGGLAREESTIMPMAMPRAMPKAMPRATSSFRQGMSYNGHRASAPDAQTAKSVTSSGAVEVSPYSGASPFVVPPTSNDFMDKPFSEPYHQPQDRRMELLQEFADEKIKLINFLNLNRSALNHRNKTTLGNKVKGVVLGFRMNDTDRCYIEFVINEIFYKRTSLLDTLLHDFLVTSRSLNDDGAAEYYLASKEANNLFADWCKQGVQPSKLAIVYALHSEIRFFTISNQNSDRELTFLGLQEEKRNYKRLRTYLMSGLFQCLFAD